MSTKEKERRRKWKEGTNIGTSVSFPIHYQTINRSGVDRGGRERGRREWGEGKIGYREGKARIGTGKWG